MDKAQQLNCKVVTAARRAGLQRSVLALSIGVLGLSASAANAQSMSDYTALPPLLQTSATPRVMLLMSNDHQLFKKAYSDYSDLDGDGELDTTYKDSIEYAGYFESDWCYNYADARFQPVVGVDEGGHRCTGDADGYWSGNFLNWATMTRMDIVRRVYYGGKRVEDTAPSGDAAALTVLERALLPTDGHAFVKVYAKNDLADFTPKTGSAISLCNVTPAYDGQPSALLSKDVQDVAPLLRVVEGTYHLWTATASARAYGTAAQQCAYRALADGTEVFSDLFRPFSGDDFFVRIEACKAGFDVTTSDHCRPYGSDDSIYKPSGLLQESGEDGSIQFGLMTGTYSQNTKGGILRRNITRFAGNTDSADDEVDLSNGQFRYSNDSGFSGGIVQALDAMRITGWDFNSGTYECTQTSAATFKDSPTCRDWGNPLAEMYMEALRYFSSEGGSPQPTGIFSDDNDNGLLGDLVSETWSDPLDGAEPCSQCAIIVMSSGLPSFDADNLSVVSDLGGLDESTISSRTDAIGDHAGLNGASVLVGNVGDNGVDDNACSAKSISLLSDVLGLCIEVPGQQGSFQLAGLASWAQTTDLRTEDGMDDMQNVDTYAVALAESLPSFSFTTSDGNSVSIVPACQASSIGAGNWSDCSLVDTRVVEQRIVESEVDGEIVRNTVYTRIDLVWEGAQFGGNYGMDAISTIEVCSSADDEATACSYAGLLDSPVRWEDNGSNQLQVRISMPQVISDFDLRLGAIVSGSTVEDGVHWIENDLGAVRNIESLNDVYTCFDSSYYPFFDELDRVVNWDGLASHCEVRMIWDSLPILTASTEAVASIEDPLWYAAKYGNFDDSDLQRLPANTSDWDAFDLEGNATPDGIPDAYFPVSNLSQLASRLTRVVEVIHRQAASGTSVAVTLERRDGVGATFQAYYYPSYKELGTNRQADWVGGLHALFLDGDLNLREDSDGDGVLTEADARVKIYYDGTDTVVERYDSEANFLAGNVAETVSFSQLRSIWDAKDRLAELTDAQVVAQRDYAGTTGRYIFTWMDRADEGTGQRDGVVDTDEVVDFLPASFDEAGEFRLLGQSDAAHAAELINYIRGSGSVDGARPRNVTLPGSNVRGEWRLGDIVHSSPLIVGRPGDEYDIDFRDPTYTAFRDQYINRRQVVYAGANDGMLHAFNAGFYSAGNATFATSGVHPVTGVAVTEYPLGAELWAYVPRNLLPHLRWLKETGYSHVFYVDGEPRAYDVNIFTPSDTHPEGWGTVLVVGFRLGGGDIDMTLDDGGTDVFTGRSAYVILDITDPEQPPTLLAEISDADLGYTTGIPALVNSRQSDSLTGVYNDDEDAWYLVFGSGPAGANALSNGVSDQNARLYVYDLNALAFVDWDADTDGIQAGLDLGADTANSFVGDPTSVDWNKDYFDDVVYFGLVGNNNGTATGSLERLTFDWSTAVGTAPRMTSHAIATMLDPGLPFQGAPTTFRDLVERRSWVLAGTGRFLTAADNGTSAANRFFGLVEPLDDVGDYNWDVVTNDPDYLANTTYVGVQSDDSVFDTLYQRDGVTVRTGAASSADVANFNELLAATQAAGGWYNVLGTLDLDGSAGALESAGARNYNGSVAINSGIGFVAFAPDQEICAPAGYSQIRFRDSRTGTASRNLFFSLEAVPDTVTQIGDAEVLNGDSDVRDGAVSRLTLVRTKDGISVGSSNNYGGIQFDEVMSMPGNLEGFGRQGWREIPIYQD